MKFISQSNLGEFAYHFWRRQQANNNSNDTDALANINREGGNQLKWLVNLYPYELPQPYNHLVQVVEIETKDEVNNFDFRVGRRSAF